jgi:transcription antitermination factor NusG
MSLKLISPLRSSSGQIYIADSETKATTRNVHTLFAPGDFISINSAMFADLNGEINLRDIWIHGDTSGDRVVVSYIEIAGSYC